MKNIFYFLTMLVMSFSTFAADDVVTNTDDVYVYNLIDLGAVNDVCGGTEAGPGACLDEAWNLITSATGEVTYTWTSNGKVTVIGNLCAKSTECKNVNDTFDVVQTFPGTNQKSLIINEKGEMFEAYVIFNSNNSRFIFGGVEVGYFVKGEGVAPDWVN